MSDLRYLDGIELFDAKFFGISPAEARDVAPEQRLLLEECAAALYAAGAVKAAAAARPGRRRRGPRGKPEQAGGPVAAGIGAPWHGRVGVCVAARAPARAARAPQTRHVTAV